MSCDVSALELNKTSKIRILGIKHRWVAKARIKTKDRTSKNAFLANFKWLLEKKLVLAQ